MTESEIRSVLRRYRIHAVVETRGDGTEVGLAWFGELPGCLAEAPTREAAIAELDAIAPTFVSGMLADGGMIPAPFVQRPRIATTRIQRVNNLVLGEVRKLQALVTDESDTVADTPNQFARFNERGELVSA